VGLDITIVNVALPAIGRDFRAPVSGLQWMIDAYLLVIASLLMLSGATADRVGRRRVFQAGLVLFTLGSLACSLAPGLGWLIAVRALQAVGGSMLEPGRDGDRDEHVHRAWRAGAGDRDVGQRARLSLALGPVVGGALVGSVGWRGVSG
jgi:MFS family permease